MSERRERMSGAELAQLARLLDRYCELELDQWEYWRAGTSKYPVYVDISRAKPDNVADDHYFPVDRWLELDES